MSADGEYSTTLLVDYVLTVLFLCPWPRTLFPEGVVFGFSERRKQYECACCVIAFTSSTFKGFNTVLDPGINPFDLAQVK